jgi:hypothetical protein
MTAQPVRTGPVTEMPLDPWVVRVMPAHEGGPWLQIGQHDAGGAWRQFASMPVTQGLGAQFSALGDVIEGLEP